MIKEFSESGKARPDDGVLLLRAEKGSEETIEELEKWGARYMDYPVYRTNYVEHDPIDMDNIDFITFTSKSCVSGLLSTQDKYILNNKKAVCIGRQTQELASESAFRTYISEEATIVSMLDKLIELSGGHDE